MKRWLAGFLLLGAAVVAWAYRPTRTEWLSRKPTDRPLTEYPNYRLITKKELYA